MQSAPEFFEVPEKMVYRSAVMELGKFLVTLESKGMHGCVLFHFSLAPNYDEFLGI